MLLGKECIVFIIEDSTVTEDLHRNVLIRYTLKNMQHLISDFFEVIFYLLNYLQRILELRLSFDCYVLHDETD